MSLGAGGPPRRVPGGPAKVRQAARPVAIMGAGP